MGALPFVTIAMPSYNEERHIEACLRSVLAQTYPADRMEVLVADGGSLDHTREIVARVAAEDPRVRLLDNSEHRIQSRGMNLCIRRSRGEYILITDVHAEYARDYVAKIVEAFLATGADVVGGAQRARAETWFQRALCAALTSPLGVGGAAYRSPTARGWVNTVFPGSFRRAILERVGLYDVHAVTNEDAELMQRVQEAGGRVWLSDEVVVHYYPRRSLGALARQYYRYGDGRARTLLIRGRFLVLRPLIPFLGLVTGITLIVVPPLQPLLPLAVGLYLAATAFEAVRVGRAAGRAAIPVVWAIFPTLHFSHALGFARGLLRHSLSPRPPLIERIEPRGTQVAP